MNTETKLHEILASLTAKGTPLRARLAHLSYGNLLIDKTLEIAAAHGLCAELNELNIERALDSGLARKLSAEIGSGKYPLVNANPGFGAAMLLGVVMGTSLAPTDRDDEDDMVPVLIGAMACQAHLDKYRADLAQYGIADNSSWDHIPGRLPEAGEAAFVDQLSGWDSDAGRAALETWGTIESARQDR
jgi:hypothetical protein